MFDSVLFSSCLVQVLFLAKFCFILISGNYVDSHWEEDFVGGGGGNFGHAAGVDCQIILIAVIFFVF